jgi:hypothetical protein
MAINGEGAGLDVVADRLNHVTLKETGRKPQPHSGSETGSSADTADISGSARILAKDPFANETSKRLFNAIDGLRECGAGQDLDLPQVVALPILLIMMELDWLCRIKLVITGRQSVGKSSLLSSLTDVPFSIGDGLCTRFATRIISRRTNPGTADVTHVSIEQGDVDPFNYPEDRGDKAPFSKSYKTLTAKDFEGIVAEVCCILWHNGRQEDNLH